MAMFTLRGLGTLCAASLLLFVLAPPCPADAIHSYDTPGDADDDGVPDVIDNAPWAANNDQADADGDGMADVLVFDLDQDGAFEGYRLGALAANTIYEVTIGANFVVEPSWDLNTPGSYLLGLGLGILALRLRRR